METYIRKTINLLVAFVVLFFSLGVRGEIKKAERRERDKREEIKNEEEEILAKRIKIIRQITQVLISMAASGIGPFALQAVGEQLGGPDGKRIGLYVGAFLGWSAGALVLFDRKVISILHQNIENLMRFGTGSCAMRSNSNL